MLRDITIGQYYNTDSVIHSLDPRVKLASTLIFLFTVFISASIPAYVVVVLVLTIVIKLSHVPFRYMIRGLKSLLFLLILSMVFNIFLTPGNVIFSIGKLQATEEGILMSLKMALRLIFLVIGSSILTLTTTPASLTAGIEEGLSFLKFFHVPVNEIAMMMSIALRFIPILIDETDIIMKAQKARGAKFDEGNLIQKAKAMAPLLIPLFIQSFRKANDLAEAMEARCYDTSIDRTRLYPLKYTLIDYKAYAFIIAYLILMVTLSFVVPPFI